MSLEQQNYYDWPMPLASDSGNEMPLASDEKLFWNNWLPEHENFSLKESFNSERNWLLLDGNKIWTTLF